MFMFSLKARAVPLKLCDVKNLKKIYGEWNNAINKKTLWKIFSYMRIFLYNAHGTVGKPCQLNSTRDNEIIAGKLGRMKVILICETRDQRKFIFSARELCNNFIGSP